MVKNMPQHEYPLVDNLNEDEVDRETLLSKPTCFIVIGRPGVGKSTLAKKLAESWKCILIDDTDVLNMHINNETESGQELLNILSEGKSIPADQVLQLVLARLNSSDVEHYGYVLSCLPLLSEESMSIPEQIEMIKNLKLPPDFIINIKCSDKDLVNRLSGLRQHPETGQLYNREQLQQEDVLNLKKDKDEEEEEEELNEKYPQKDPISQLVWIPENLPRNAFPRIKTYSDTMLRPLEDYMTNHNPLYLLELDGNMAPEELHSSVMSRLGSMAIKRVSVPVLLLTEEIPEETEEGDLFRLMFSARTVAPGFRWRRSRWGQKCPVALKEGKLIPGRPEFSVGFQDKLYTLSSQEAYQKFVTNPRQYLLPPMPRPLCRVAIIGPPKAGKTTLCKLLAQHYKAQLFDMEELVQPLLEKVEQQRFNQIKEETTKAAIEKVKVKMQQGLDEDSSVEVAEDHPDVQALVLTAWEDVKHMRTDPKDLYAEALENQIKEIEEADAQAETKTGWVLDNFPKNNTQLNDLQKLQTLPDTIICLRDNGGDQILKRLYEKNEDSVDEETTDIQLQLQQFMSKWEQMEPYLTMDHLVLNIDDQRPEELLQKVILYLEKPFQYLSWEHSEVDLNEEAEDFEALAELDRTEEGSSVNYEAEEEENQEPSTAGRLLGDTHHFCPVALKNNNVLIPCKEEFAVKYRERTFYLSSLEAKDSFLENPVQFVAQTEPLKPPALRICLLGTRGSGKTTQGEWLAKQLGIFHIQYRELLQMIITAKLKRRVPYSDEVEPTETLAEDLEALIKAARNEEETEMEDPDIMHDEEAVLTHEEKVIKAFLSDGDPLPSGILDDVIAPFWKQEPYRSTGFILEGFPQNCEEVQYMHEKLLYPDVYVVMTVEFLDVQRHLLPTYFEKWREHRCRYEKQLNLLHILQAKAREKTIAQRRAELMVELGGNAEKTMSRHGSEGEEEEDEATGNIENEIVAMLEEEFPVEEDSEETEIETDEAATQRLEMEIADRFVTDENGLFTVTGLLSKRNIPKISVCGSSTIQNVHRQLFRKIQPLVANRESLFMKCQPISYSLAQKLLLSSFKLHSAFGCLDPVKQYNKPHLIQPLQWPLSTSYPVILQRFIYFFSTKENRKLFMLNPLKYLRQPKPLASLPVKIAVLGPPKSGKTTVAKLFAKKYGLAELSIGGVMRTVLDTQEHTDLAVQMKKYLSQGLVVPDELAIQCLEVALMSTVCNTRGYMLDGFPKTLNQAELMRSRGIIPMIAVELELDTVEVLKRGLLDKMKPNKPHVMHDSSDILHSRYLCYKQEMEKVRQHFQLQYQNWILLDGQKSLWWLMNKILKEISASVRCIHNFLERMENGKAACINRLCITPEELQSRLGQFGQFCPVCLALHCHLMDCSEVAALTYAAQYRDDYYRMCGAEHLEIFLTNPDQFLTPGCVQALQQSHLLPHKLTEAQVKNKFPQQVEMKGFCPVTYLDGKQRYEALVPGKMEFAVEYKGRIYLFETKQKQDKFLRTPETYWDQKLKAKVPPLCKPVPLTSLPTLGYLEQGVAVPVIKAMTAVGLLKPKYPFLRIQRSAVQYVAFYLKAFNDKSTDIFRQEYKKKLALFEENCALLPYLISTMEGNYKPVSERPIDFKFKLKRFLALGEFREQQCAVVDSAT